MSLIKVKNIIKKEAWTGFPAQKLWIRDIDLHFWAYDKNEEKISLTEGKFIEGKLQYKTTDETPVNVESFIDELIKKKESEGYECFASQLFV